MKKSALVPARAGTTPLKTLHARAATALPHRSTRKPSPAMAAMLRRMGSAEDDTASARRQPRRTSAA